MMNANNSMVQSVVYYDILVLRGRAPFGQHQESRPLARSNDIPFLNENETRTNQICQT